MFTTLKTLNATEGRVGGYLIVWGSPQQRDLQGEYFTPETELALEWYAERPVLYHHGLDGALKAAVIGTIDTLKPDAAGLWAEAQLDLRKRYVRTVLQLVERGILDWSSNSLPHLVEIADDGHIRRWPLIEGSLTPAPAEPRRTDVQTIKSAYGALGLDTERLTLPDNPSPTGEPMDNELPLINDEPKTPARKRLPLANREDATKTRITVTSPYDRYDAMDMLHGYVLLRSTKHFQGVSQPFANALAHKVQKAGLTGLKADELSYSTQAGFGDD